MNSRCLLFLLFLAQAAFAQMSIPKFEAAAKFDTSLNLHAESGDVRVSVDKRSGRFSIEHSDGTPALFTRNGFSTSYTNVRVGNYTFTNNTLYGPQTPAGTMKMPEGYAVIDSNAIVYRARIITLYGAVDFEQRFTPQTEPNFHFVRINTTIMNRSSSAIPLGALCVFDLMAGGSDAVEVLLNGMPVQVESEFRGAILQTGYIINSPYIPFRIKGRLAGAGSTPPDQFVVGRWQYNGYLGAANWNYIPSGLPMGDNAMLMQWNQTVVQPNNACVVATDYGIESNRTRTDAEISCTIMPTIWNDSLQLYQPNPFDIRARVTNTGTTSINGCVVAIGPMLNGLSLFPGEPASKTISGTILPNASADVLWRIVTPIFLKDSIVTIPVRITQPPTVMDTCIGQTAIPSARIKKETKAELYCGPKIILEKDKLGAGLEPNPFLVEPRITNIGTENLDSLYATILLPPGLNLISGRSTQMLNPFPLLPGLSVSPTWLILATPSFKADSSEYIVRVQNKQGIVLECKSKVVQEAVDVVTACNEGTQSTKGREFWFGFPRSPEPSLSKISLFVSASQLTDVRIIFPALRDTITALIFPNNVIHFPLDIGAMANSSVPDENSIHLLASEPVGVTIIRERTPLSEVTQILPVDALGTEFVTIGGGHELVITAVEDNTTLQLAPRPMKRGESITVGSTDGYALDTNKPVQIIRNAGAANILGGIAFEGHALMEFLPARTVMGKDYVVAPFLSRFGGSWVQIYTAEDGNIVRVNGKQYPLPNRSNSVSLILQEPTHISADKKIEVMQFTMPTFFDKTVIDPPYGDGSVVSISPADRFAMCHLFPTLLANHFDFVAVTLVVHNGAQKSVAINGRLISDTTFHPVPNAPFRYARLQVQPGKLQVTTTDFRGVGVVVYGFGLYDGFSYNPGFLTDKRTSEPNIVTELQALRTFSLEQNHPNPFGVGSETQSPVTNIVVNTKAGRGALRVYNAMGKEIAMLANQEFPAGRHSILFDSRSPEITPGMYYVRFEMEGKVETKKMVIVR